MLFMLFTNVVHAAEFPQIYVEIYDSEDPVAVGGSTKYMVSIKNEGNVPATNMNVAYEFSKEILPVGYDNNSRPEKVQLGSIPSFDKGASLNYEVQVNTLAAGDALFKLIVTYDQFAKEIISEENTLIYE